MVESSEIDLSLFDQLPQPSWVFDCESLRFLIVNRAAVEAYGYTLDEFLAMTIKDIRPAVDLPRLMANVRLGHDGIDVSGLWRHVRKDGSIIDVEITSRNIQYAGRQCELVVAVNVTGKALLIERLQVACSAARLGIWEYDIAAQKLIWDPINSGVYGSDRSLFPNTIEKFWQMVVPDFREKVQTAFAKCLSDGDDYAVEFKMTLPDGKVAWRSAFGRRLVDSVGVPTHIIGVGIDITSIKQLEVELARTQRMEAIGRLASGIAHDFNNILTIIQGYSSLLLEESDLGNVRASAAEIQQASFRAARLTNQLLQFSRKVPQRPVLVSLNAAVEETVRFLQRLIPDSIEIAVQLEKSNPYVMSDPGHLEQMLMNLCLNARDAITSRGTIFISTQTQRDSQGQSHAVVRVSDTGTGIDSSVLPRIFDPFFTTKEMDRGSGLGLSIVHGIATQMGARIEVESQVNAGSTFTISIPAGLPGQSPA